MKFESTKRYTIALIIPELFDSYQNIIWKGIKNRIESFGFKLLCFVGGAFDFYENKHLFRNEIYNLITPKTVDAMLLMSGPLTVETGLSGITDFLEQYTGIPAVSIAVEIPGTPSVVIDNESGMYEVIKHMIADHGCKRIAFIKGPEKNEEAIQRFAAYKRCLTDYNIDYDPALVCSGIFHPEDGVKAVKTLLDERKVEFDALVGVDDAAALSAIESLKKRGYAVPGEVKIAGFDDIERSQFSSPELTTVRQPLVELGYLAVDMALDLLEKRPVPMVKKVKTSLIIRRSCGCNLVNLSTDITVNGGYSSMEYLDSYILHMDKLEALSMKDLIVADDDNQFIKVYNKKLVDALVFSLKLRNTEPITRVLESVLQDSFNKGISFSYWSNIIITLMSSLIERGILEMDRKLYDFLINELQSFIYKTEIRLWAYFALVNDELSQDLQRFGDNIMICFSIEELKDTLIQGLPYFKVSTLIFSLYKKNKKWSTLIFYNGEDRDIRLENRIYNTHTLFPDEIESANDKSFVILPIVSDREQLGFILVEISDINEKIYDFLSEKIAGALKGIYMMNKINSHAADLEREVAKRTRELKKANKQLKYQSFKDQLSGLNNRRFLMEVILPDVIKYIEVFNKKRKTLKKKDRRTKLNISYAIVLLDIDHFKIINDTYGHISGDMVIAQLSQLFIANTRKMDYIVRMGGEEFLIVLKEFDSSTIAAKVNEIREVVEHNLFRVSNGKVIQCTCSIGCVTYPLNFDYPKAIDFMQAISLADKALYHAKDNGRNQSIILQINHELISSRDFFVKSCRSFNHALKKGIFSFKNAIDIISEQNY